MPSDGFLFFFFLVLFGWLVLSILNLAFRALFAYLLTGVNAEAEKKIRLLLKGRVGGCLTLRVVGRWPQSAVPLLASCARGMSIYQEHLTHAFGR